MTDKVIDVEVIAFPDGTFIWYKSSLNGEIK